MSSKQHWKDRAIRMEKYRDEVAEQRSQALADLDREAKEVDLLRTAIVQLFAFDALRVWGDGRWETDEKRANGAVFTPDQVEAIDRAKKVISDRNAALQTVEDRVPGYGLLPSARPLLTAERVARGLGAVPLEALDDADARERGRVRLAQAAVMGNHRNAATESRRQEALDEVDVNVTLADAATVIRTVRDDLLDPDRPLSLGALALLLGSVLPRIEYQAGCEQDIYRRLNDVVLHDAVARAIADAARQAPTMPATASERLATAALAEMRRHLPKLTQEVTSSCPPD